MGWGEGEITLVLELSFLRTLKPVFFCGTVLDFFFSEDHAYLQNKNVNNLLYIGLSVDSNLEMVKRLIKKSCFATIGYIRVRVGSKNPSLVNTVCHHSADIVGTVLSLQPFHISSTVALIIPLLLYK